MAKKTERQVSAHYTRGNLLDAIEHAIDKAGKTRKSITLDDLAAVDEFHIGGRQASEHFLDQLALASTHHLLDVGCGLGGAARFAAARYDVTVSGIDLTEEFVETGNTLCRWLGLDGKVTLRQASALAMPFEDHHFDGAYMMHVGMNIAEKETLVKEVFRVLRPGSCFGIYDVMQMDDGDLIFPVPWASTPEESYLSSPASYRHALETAGFAIQAERNRRDFALDFFKQMQARMAASGGPPPLGLHIVMGELAPTKIGNMLENIGQGRIAPVELIARKPA